MLLGLGSTSFSLPATPPLLLAGFYKLPPGQLGDTGGVLRRRRKIKGRLGLQQQASVQGRNRLGESEEPANSVRAPGGADPGKQQCSRNPAAPVWAPECQSAWREHEGSCCDTSGQIWQETRETYVYLPIEASSVCHFSD